ncbi:hypothetical protein AMECASPLE_028190 [Ameca splendens]|uniref:Uncharacterized protein n=1 Tax=Ameca splendens TaxID=208324 RepID=A0ABV0XUU0_9TELE
MDPEIRDPGTYHSPSRGPTKPRSPGPGKQPPRVSQHTPKHPAPDTENHKYTGGQRYQPLWRGGNRPHIRWGPKLIQEREQPKTQPDTNNRHTQSHIPTLMHTHKNTHPRTQHKDKQQWTSYTHSHSPYILYTPRSRCRYPIGTTSPRIQEVDPFAPGVETGRPPHQLSLV